MADQDIGPAPPAGTLVADELLKSARRMGPHLFECAGNNNPANFGLISVAEWDGVPLTEIVSRLQPAAGATAVLVSGVDPDEPSASGSTAGASWVIPLWSLGRPGTYAIFLRVADTSGPQRRLDVGYYMREATV